jgi:glycosyltransferase involved in cell wall biosynthesis
MLEMLQSSEKRPGSSVAMTWHLLTCEYPPQSGGVSDYTYLLAGGLAASNDEVHVWCPAAAGDAPAISGVTVHPALGKFRPSDLRNVGRQLNKFPRPRRLMVQWVPHGYGYKSLNLAICLWLWYRRARCGDRVDLMVHEPFLPFKKGRWRQNTAAVWHRLMMMTMLRTADAVWMSTPSWENMISPFALGRRHTYRWLPLPSTVPVVDDPSQSASLRYEYAPGGLLIGHFSTFGSPVTAMLAGIIPELLGKAGNASMLLIGPGGGAFRDRILGEHPDLEKRIHAVGQLNARDPRLSLLLGACDLLIQPYPEGVTSRRTTIMAALSHGRAAVTTTAELTESFWQESGAVALAPSKDLEAFVSESLKILENASARASLGERARSFYQSEFDVPHIVDLLREQGITAA